MIAYVYNPSYSGGGALEHRIEADLGKKTETLYEK
jgi:hypothetical protein